MGWLSPEHSQWMWIARKWYRLVNMDESLLAKKIVLSHLTQSSTNRKIWCYRGKMFFIEIEQEHICQGHRLAVRATLNTINSQLHVYFERIWREKLNTEFAVRGQDAGGNKLRTYRKIKENYNTEQYVKVITQKRYWSAYAIFRCGVAPIKLKPCRYGLNCMPVDQRLCESCKVVEDECHEIMHCHYDDIRTQLFT